MTQNLKLSKKQLRKIKENGHFDGRNVVNLLDKDQEDTSFAKILASRDSKDFNVRKDDEFGENAKDVDDSDYYKRVQKKLQEN